MHTFHCVSDNLKCSTWLKSHSHNTKASFQLQPRGDDSLLDYTWYKPLHISGKKWFENFKTGNFGILLNLLQCFCNVKAMLILSVLLFMFFNNTVFYIGNREKCQVHGQYKPRELKQKKIPGYQPSRQFQVSHLSLFIK